MGKKSRTRSAASDAGDPMPSGPAPRTRLQEALIHFAIAAVVFGATLASFWPTLHNGFVDWDDTGMFLENIDYRGINWANIQWMFTTFHYAHYHPVTWLTLGLDYEIWGLNPKGYHLTSLILHCLNAVLLYWLVNLLIGVITRTTSGSGVQGSNTQQRPQLPANAPGRSVFATAIAAICCGIGALFWSIHPLRVESVAWATERRDVLSGFFYLLTLIAYVRAHTGSRTRIWLGLSVLFFLLSFLSKAWGITLPIVLLLLDVYPLQRVDPSGWLRASTRNIGLLKEKIPFFLISFVLAVVAYRGQAEWGIVSEQFGLWQRLASAAYGLCFYLWKTVVPLDLSPLYLLPLEFNPFESRFMLCAATVIGATLGLWFARHRGPGALVAWAGYAVIVSPVIGLTQHGEQIAADRYTYLCLLPVAALAGAGLHRSVCLLGTARHPLVCAAFSALALVPLLGLSLLTNRQTKVWATDETLWEQAVKVEPWNPVALNGRGRNRMQRGDYLGAIADFDEALRLNPKKVESLNNRGMAYHQQGNLDAALTNYIAALKLKAYYQTLNNIGALKETRGDWEGAIESYSASLRLNPKYSVGYYNRGRARKHLGDLRAASNDFDVALKFDPNYGDAYLRRGDVSVQLGNLRAAIQDYSTALRMAAPGSVLCRDAAQRLASAQAAAR